MVCVSIVVDRPSCAGQPAVTSITRRSVVLSWYGCCYDGGSTVTGYRIEQRQLQAGTRSTDNQHWQLVTDSCQVYIQASTKKSAHFLHALTLPEPIFSARQRAERAIGYRKSVCLSVCLSITLVDQSKTVEVRVVQFSPYSSPILLLFAI